MKKQLMVTMAVLALSAGSAYATVTAAPGAGVVGSVHDMAASEGITDVQGRVCAFCHTPHHADVASDAQKAPLWSRAANNNTYTPYASSSFDVTKTTNYSDPAIGTTRLCLSCHDASLAVDNYYGKTSGTQHINSSDDFGGPNIGAAVGVYGGGGLGNDHPLGFDYAANQCATSTSDVTVVDTTAAGSCGTVWDYIRNLGSFPGTQLVYNGNTNIKVQDRLWTPDGTKFFMTCATCHDVHNKKNKDLAGGGNYLVMSPQLGSALCVTCHIK